MMGILRPLFLIRVAKKLLKLILLLKSQRDLGCLIGMMKMKIQNTMMKLSQSQKLRKYKMMKRLRQINLRKKNST